MFNEFVVELDSLLERTSSNSNIKYCITDQCCTLILNIQKKNFTNEDKFQYN